MNISVAEYLTKRSVWEEMTMGFKLKNSAGTVDNLKWFIRYGRASNRFRPGYEESLNIAKSIIDDIIS
tara:strand:- start:70 stop:273 length:204 start_codon:yes stop_codon:yes gene_type:complete